MAKGKKRSTKKDTNTQQKPQQPQDALCPPQQHQQQSKQQKREKEKSRKAKHAEEIATADAFIAAASALEAPPQHLVIVSRSSSSSTAVRLFNFQPPDPLPLRLEDTAQNSVEREIVVRYNTLIQAAKDNSLTLDNHVAPFISFLSSVRQSLIERHNAITRKFKIRRAMLARATLQTVDKHYHEMCILEVQEEAVKRDQNAFNLALNLLHQSEPYKEFVRFGQEHMIHLPNGQYIMKDDELDCQMDFEEYLANEKRSLGLVRN